MKIGAKILDYWHEKGSHPYSSCNIKCQFEVIAFFRAPCWRYTARISRKPCRNTKLCLHNISLLLLLAFIIDWSIIFEFGFTEFIHSWLINTNNYDNGWLLKLIFGMNCQFNMHMGRQLKVILGSHCIVYIFVSTLI